MYTYTCMWMYVQVYIHVDANMAAQHGVAWAHAGLSKVWCMYVCMSLTWVRGCSMCTCVCARTLQHAKQGRTLDYSPIEWT